MVFFQYNPKATVLGLFLLSVFLIPLTIFSKGDNGKRSQLRNLSSQNTTLVIGEISFEGLERTNSTFLLSLLDSYAGGEFNQETIENDLQRLRNLRLFESVELQTKVNASKNVTIIFVCKEVLTRIPAFGFGGIKDNVWFQLGYYDSNVYGRSGQLGIWYRYYDRHSFEISHQSPWIGSKMRSFTGLLGRYATLEPTHIAGNYIAYNVDRIAVTGKYSRALSSTPFRHRMGVGFSWLRELYLKQAGEDAFGPNRALFNKFVVQTTLSTNTLNYFDVRLAGIQNDLLFERVKTIGETETFYKFLNVFKWFKILGRGGNFATRVRTGIATNRKTVFAPFVLDSYLNVRGSGNRVTRGSAEVTVTAEYRHIITTKRWGVVQSVGFVDWSAWRPAGGTLDDLTMIDNTVTFAGGGLRVVVRSVYNLAFRVDYGVSLYDASQRGLVFGIGQYF